MIYGSKIDFEETLLEVAPYEEMSFAAHFLIAVTTIVFVIGFVVSLAAVVDCVLALWGIL